MVQALAGEGVRVPDGFATTADAYREVIEKSKTAGIKIGICGQAPSNYPDFAAFLVERGIDSISLNPDGFVKTIAAIAKAERMLGHALGDVEMASLAEGC